MNSSKQGENRVQQGEDENNPLDIERNSQATSANLEGLVKWVEQERLKDGFSRPLGDKSTSSESGSDPASQEGEKKARKTKGETKGEYQTLEYRDGDRWVPAVYHESVRHYLITEARKRGEYDYPRESGIEPDDVTSFLESQKSWGPERDKNWAEILYVFEKKQNHYDPTYKPKRWKVGQRIVLASRDSLPLLDYSDMPATLSSAFEGRDMEAIKRTDPRIKQRDFIARMPMKYTSHRGKRRKVQSASSIGMKMTRFRQEHGMLSWVGREGSQTIRDALWASLPERNKRENSIRGLKPLTALEQEKVREGNYGKFDKNAGKRALPEKERALRRKKKQERRERQQKRLATRSESAATRPNVRPSSRALRSESQKVDIPPEKMDPQRPDSTRQNLSPPWDPYTEPFNFGYL